MDILSDTHPEITEYQLALIRDAPVCRRLEIAGQMFETIKALAMAGLRKRHPDADQDELTRRWADILLGQELAAKVYGPNSWHESSK